MHFLGLRHKHEQTVASHGRKKTGYFLFLDRLTLVAGTVGPFTVVPQIYTIFSSRSASGVSLTTWILIFIVTFPWILYGAAHRDKVVMGSFILWEVVNLLVVIGVFLYG